MMILVIMLSYTGILRPAGRKALCVFVMWKVFCFDPIGM